MTELLYFLTPMAMTSLLGEITTTLNDYTVRLTNKRINHAIA